MSVAKGKGETLYFVEWDIPLDDIANTRTIAAVVTDGRFLSRQDLTQMQTKLKQLAAPPKWEL